METSQRAPRVRLQEGLAALSAAVFLALSVPATAAEGWYATAIGGLTFQGDEDGTLTDTSGTTSASLEFDTGFGAGAAVGRWFNDQFRGELEWLYRTNDNDSVVTGDGRSTGEGNLGSTALSLNGYYHFGDTDAVGQIDPYLGAGISFVNEIDIDLEAGDFGPAYEDLEDDGVGFQVMGGVSYRQTEQLRWQAELRWLFYGDADLVRSGGPSLTDIGYSPLGIFVGVSFDF